MRKITFFIAIIATLAFSMASCGNQTSPGNADSVSVANDTENSKDDDMKTLQIQMWCSLGLSGLALLFVFISYCTRPKEKKNYSDGQSFDGTNEEIKKLKKKSDEQEKRLDKLENEVSKELNNLTKEDNKLKELFNEEIRKSKPAQSQGIPQQYQPSQNKAGDQHSASKSGGKSAQTPSKPAKHLYATMPSEIYFTQVAESKQDSSVFDIELSSDTMGTFTVISIDKLKQKNGLEKVVKHEGNCTLPEATTFDVLSKGKCEKIPEKGYWQIIEPLKIKISK